jgi:hypothetical protein
MASLIEQTAPAMHHFSFDAAAMNLTLRRLLQTRLQPDAWQWLEEKGGDVNRPGSNALAVAFAAMPRKVGKAPVNPTTEEEKELTHIRAGFSIRGWNIDRLARVWLLLQLDASDKEQYIRRIEQLFPAAEMNELAALYAALPLLAYLEAWRHRCAEGIRSNIGLVLEAIICNNPYPAEQLPEGAWNQLVLKAFFTEKRVDQVVGLDKRANEDLSQMLLHFAHERWAAGRQAPPLLWRCVAPFLNEQNFSDLERAFNSENDLDREAAALACAQTTYAPAKALLQKERQLQKTIDDGAITWTSIAEKAAAQ